MNLFTTSTLLLLTLNIALAEMAVNSCNKSKQLNPCHTKVTISCVVTGGYEPLIGADCLNDATSTGQLIPFYSDAGPESSCEDKTITTKVTYRLCNKNDDPIRLYDASFVQYRGESISFSKGQLEGGDCRKVEEIREWDLCDINPKSWRRQRPFQVNIEGKILPSGFDSGDDNNCQCHTAGKSTIFYEILEETVTTSPTPSPTSAPTPAPSPAPTIASGPSKGKSKKGKGSNSGRRALRRSGERHARKKNV